MEREIFHHLLTFDDCVWDQRVVEGPPIAPFIVALQWTIIIDHHQAERGTGRKGTECKGFLMERRQCTVTLTAPDALVVVGAIDGFALCIEFTGVRRKRKGTALDDEGIKAFPQFISARAFPQIFDLRQFRITRNSIRRRGNGWNWRHGRHGWHGWHDWHSGRGIQLEC